MEYRLDEQGKAEGLELLLDRFRVLKIDVFAREHPPPHFRIVRAGETANYRISDCQQLKGGLRKYSRIIRQWRLSINIGSFMRETLHGRRIVLSAFTRNENC